MRQTAHDAHILKRHMRPAVVAGRHARIRGNHLHVIALVVQGHKQLVEAATAGKGGKGMDERLTSGERQPGGRPNHVGLHNAAVDNVLWIITRYAVHRHRTHQIRFERNDLAPGLNLFCHKTRIDLTHLNRIFLSCRCNLNHVKPPVGESSR